MKRCIFYSALILLMSAYASAQEFRGIWVDAFHDGFKTPQQTTEMVNRVADANLNAIFVQVRKRGDAYYNSAFEPRAQDMAAGYDALADIIQKAHARGIEVHAWLSLLAVSNKIYTLGPDHVSNKHPEWLTKEDWGGIYGRNGNVYLDPGLPEVREFLRSIVLDILQKYPVDGIHLDGLCYDYPRLGYNPTAVESFNKQYGRTDKPEFNDPDWCEWRRQQINALAEQISTAVRSANPKAKLTATVMGSKDEVFKSHMADWQLWTSKGYVDALTTLNLFDKDDEVLSHAGQSLAVAEGKHVYVGLGAWRNSMQVTGMQIDSLRQGNVRGFVMFSYAYTSKPTDGGTSILDGLKTSRLAHPAAVPAMGWK